MAVIYGRFQCAQAEKRRDTLLAECSSRPVFPPVVEEGLNIQVNLPPKVEVAQNEEPASLSPEETIAERVNKNPYDAAEWAEEQPAGYERIAALNQVATAWAEQDVSAAMVWATHLTNPEDRVSTTSAALFQWGQTDPQKAISYAESCDLGDQTISTMGVLVQKLADNDLTSAILYVSRQASGNYKDELLARVTMVAAERYPSLAGQMVSERMNPGPAQNEAAIAVLHQWALKDPAGATAWAETFPEEKLRERALSEVAGTANAQFVNQ